MIVKHKVAERAKSPLAGRDQSPPPTRSEQLQLQRQLATSEEEKLQVTDCEAVRDFGALCVVGWVFLLVLFGGIFCCVVLSARNGECERAAVSQSSAVCLAA